MGFFTSEYQLTEFLKKHAAFVREKGRLPLTWFANRQAVWALFMIPCLLGVHYFLWQEEPRRWFDPVTMVLLLMLVVNAVQNLLANRFIRLATSRSAEDAWAAVDAFLLSRGYEPCWQSDANIGFMTADFKTRLWASQRHLVVMVFEDGVLWITAYNLEAPFVMQARRKPLRNLIALIREGLADEAEQHRQRATAAR